MKKYPNVGDKGSLEAIYSGMIYPVTVDHIKSGYVYVRKAKLIFNRPRYYDTLPDKIEDDLDGEIIKLSWRKKTHSWRPVGDNYSYCKFDGWSYYPNLN